MKARGLLWFLVPALGLLELGGHLHFAQVAPTLAEWEQIEPAVRALRQQSEPVVVAPGWAEPNARYALGDRLMPIEQVARADLSSSERAIELSILGQHADELAGWVPVSEQRHGAFTLRVLSNPSPAQVVTDFFELLPRARVALVDRNGRERPCPWTRAARQTAGGLHGHPAFPSDRFRCPGAEYLFVGVTVIEDQHYRPRRCIWAHPVPSALLRIEFPSVPLGKVLRGYTGLPWMVERDRRGEPVAVALSVDDRELGRVDHRDGEGWAPFEVPLGAYAGKPGAVTLTIGSRGGRDREYCLQLDSR